VKIVLIAVLAVFTFGLGTSAWYVTRQQTEAALPSAAFPKITYLTQDGRIKDAAVSSDAQLLAYVPIEAGKQSLWIRDLKQGNAWQLIAPDFIRCWGMRFTPDGQNLLYISAGLEGSLGELFRIPVRGGSPQKIAANVSEPPAIAPGGQKIAYVRANPADKQDVLFIANIDGSEEKQVSVRLYPDTFSPSGISWSADGKSIALGIGRNNNTENAIAAISINEASLVELTPWKWAAVGGAAWESDNQGIVFSARETGSRFLRIWRLSLADNRIQPLTDADNAFEEVTLSQTGNLIVTNRTYEVSDIWSENLSGTQKRLTTQGNDGADGLTVSPTGQVIFTEGEYEQSFIWSIDMDGGNRKQLTKNNGFLPAASRDGRFIAYVSTESGTHHIWLMSVDGQNNRQLTIGDGENYPSFSPDGNWVVYTVLGKERNTLWKISTTGNEKPVQITQKGFTIKPQVSPDGTMIACTYRKNESEPWKIVVLPIDGGTPLKTLELPAPRYQMIRWTPDSAALIFLDKKNGIQNLWQQPLDGSPAKQITNFSEDQILHQDITADGKELILSRGGRRRDIALIKNYK
jgi:Tol biopolymer transport system component